MGRDIVRVGGATVQVQSPADTAAFLERALDFHRMTDPDGTEHLAVDGGYDDVPRRVLTLRSGGGLELAEVSLDLGADVPLDRLMSKAAGLDVEAEERDGSIALRDPDGIRIVVGPGADAPGESLEPSGIRPRRLGHVNLNVTDTERSAGFYTEVLGLALSERIGDLLYFFRASSEHHNVGIRGGADRAGVHHIAFEVHGWESFRAICDHVADLGHTVEYGPGRHGPGHNLFVYLRDPHSGLRLELFADMAHIEDEDGYEPPVWETGDRSRTVNRWGPAPPESFLA